ncbi:MAG: hypothetical protein K8I27_09510 [Planctomycetes bacterium]|nr:hypothetical protein [Planctomycetota bacterium]
MPWLILLVCLLAAPLAAEYESNFGRVILAKSDLIVQGVASATRTRVGNSFRVEVTVENTLHGDEKQNISFLYTDAALLPQEAARGLYALKSVTDETFSLVGKPVFTPQGDAEERDKLKVARAFIALEAQEQGDERTEAFYKLLTDHVELGGYPAQNAAVELMFVARDRGASITEERFDALIRARKDGLNRLIDQTRKDLELAFQGMVEARVKSLKFRHVRRGADKGVKRQGADDLLALQTDYPRAFTDADASLADALREASDDALLKGKLSELAKVIREEVKARAVEDAAREREARERVRHAEED